MKYVGNGFGLGMLRDVTCLINSTELTEEEFNMLAYDAHSVIGHKDLAGVLGLEYNRESITLNPGDVFLIAYLYGKGRLPEGATSMPDDVELRFACLQIIKK